MVTRLRFVWPLNPLHQLRSSKKSLNTTTGEQTIFAVKGRHDLCIALRVPVVVEAVTAIVLTDLLMLEQRIGRINQ